MFIVSMNKETISIIPSGIVSCELFEIFLGPGDAFLTGVDYFRMLWFEP